jgi:protease-4
MKQFIKFMFASALGTFIAVLLVITFFVALLAGTIMNIQDDAVGNVKIFPHSVIRINWKTDIKDRTTNNPFESFDFASMESNKPVGLNDILKNIDKAKQDNNVDGIFLDMETLPAGQATLEEIRNKLTEFKKSGKFIYSYANNYDQKAYYLATVSDKIVLNPEGFILFKGLHAQLTFIKGLLNKLDIETQIIRGPDNKYKSAVEPLLYDKATPANREQLTAMLDAVWGKYLKTVSESRGISIDKLNQIADNLELATAEKALEAHFIDKIAYRDEVLDMLKTKTGSEKINFVSFKKYTNVAAKIKTNKAKDRIAVIYAEGDIKQGKSSPGTIGSESLAETIRKVRSLDRVKAIVFRVNSPGGDAQASEIIRRELSLAAQKVPVIVSMGNVAASGGYWISTPGKYIFAEASTITGSIGVFGIIPNLQKLFNNKLGITFDDIKTNENADFIDVMKPMSEFQKAKINQSIKRIYGNFVSLVSKSRKLDEQYVDSIARGRVWAGSDALKVGLIDSIGGLEAAINAAAREAKLGDLYKISEYPVEKEFFQALMEEISGETTARFIKSEMGDYYKYYEQASKVKNMQGIQARLPYFMEIN